MEGNTITPALEDMTIETVIGDVEPAIGKLLRKRWVRPVKNLSEGRMPVHELP